MKIYLSVPKGGGAVFRGNTVLEFMLIILAPLQISIRYGQIICAISLFYISTEYTEIGGDEELPLGPEFQNHINCFIDQNKKNSRDKYKLTGKLVQQLS